MVVGMPIMSQRRPKSFKTLLVQQEIILLAHCWEVVGWYTNDKFTEAQSEAIVGKWLVGVRLAKWTFPTVGQQSLRSQPMLVQLLCATWVGYVCISYPALLRFRISITLSSACNSITCKHYLMQFQVTNMEVRCTLQRTRKEKGILNWTIVQLQHYQGCLN